MKIKDVLFTKSYTGFYFDDQKAIKAGAKNDGFNYLGEPKTLGFTKIRQAGEAVSIQIILEDGSVGYGDCAAVQYSGAGGRDPLFLADDAIKFLEKEIKPLLLKEDFSEFKSLAEKYDHLVINGKRLHTAIRYGVTQAILSAVAASHKVTMAEVVRKEYKIKEKEYKPVPVFTQSGDDRYVNAEKMIIKEAEILPHALINHVETKLGKKGEILKEYLVWLKNRIKSLGKEGYNPIIQIDVYGTIGLAFNNDVKKMTEYLIDLEKTVAPLSLRIEGPVDVDCREETMALLRDIRKALEAKQSKVEIVADEWCNTLEDIKYFADNKAGHILQIKTPDLGGINNTIEAILYCNKKGIGSYCGGTCNETDISAKTTTQIALACSASQILAKPGMGVDEALMLARNEIARVCAVANWRRK
ncbi:MAG: methylaspartate ammonia-lyase [Bacilli bacterium]|jgi:methylaspartate ammonia-lyase|nr:methylaspartate ammonia-lyase [Bacilli bacterium]